ncbi:hypothetical protein JOQ06_018854 [Pogonophryne albipinna]|uniref:Uncharacterized protein n=1 Tax=Pogonophryne albipinna TaxID=1090488 RepID=A0AAD6FDI4_9TELE|nr:hypothetical protein JOQ06_018854 [Pogonophryne albipinna]
MVNERGKSQKGGYLKLFTIFNVICFHRKQRPKSCQVLTTLKSSADDLQSLLRRAHSLNQDLNPSSPWGKGGTSLFPQPGC